MTISDFIFLTGFVILAFGIGMLSIPTAIILLGIGIMLGVSINVTLVDSPDEKED